MWGFISLARPLNCVMSAVGVGIAAVATVGLAGVAARALSIGIAGLVGALFTAAGNALNDYYDRDTDRVNHPDRPIPRGEVSPSHARLFAAVLFAASFVGALAVNVEAILVVAANLATTGREIAKDIEDVAGDVDRRTLPKRIGVRPAGAVASAAFVASAIFSLVPFSFAGV